MELERIIQHELTTFIQSHVPAADLSGMDDVFFSYVTSILEELGCPKSVDENFDMETFVEMMEAYIPGPPRTVACIIQSLDASAALLQSLTPSLPPQEMGICEMDPGGALDNALDMMLEMFPAFTVSQAKKALDMALRGLEEAAQLLLAQPDTEASSPEKSPKQDGFKQFILQKYVVVDSEENQKTHKPALPKEDPKKLIHYIENQVVTAPKGRGTRTSGGRIAKR